jgi:steroid delta-isomerase
VATPEQIRAAFERYVTLLSAHDGEAVAALFADDAVIEDPAGSAPREGREAIRAFYVEAIGRADPTVVLTGPVRILADGTAGAAPMQSRSIRDGRPVTLDIVDVFTFDDAGRITSMRAYWGPENIAAREA